MPLSSATHARLVASIHKPWRAPIRECLERWRGMDDARRTRAYLVIEGPEPRVRRTLNAAQIEALLGGA